MKFSAGVLPYKWQWGQYVVLLSHPTGGNGWSIVKGEFDVSAETPKEASSREWFEETGLQLNSNDLTFLGETSSKRKKIFAFILDASSIEIDETTFTCNYFEKEQPDGSTILLPENDDYKWFTLDDASKYLFDSQKELINLLKLYLEV